MPRESDNSAPAIITDHPFEPRGEWWTRCRRCDLAEAAHSEAAGECVRCGVSCEPGVDLCDWCDA